MLVLHVSFIRNNVVRDPIWRAKYVKECLLIEDTIPKQFSNLEYFYHRGYTRLFEKNKDYKGIFKAQNR